MMQSVMNKTEQNVLSKFISMVCIGKSEEELKQAKANFIRFIKLAERVNNRLHREKQQKELDTEKGNTLQ